MHNPHVHLLAVAASVLGTAAGAELWALLAFTPRGAGYRRIHTGAPPAQGEVWLVVRS